ncbi:MBG domain-containing protein [Luteolibacter marinus]|uniref:MBG domain-containing protein n=1 Tax=Luteolibacter marinus TaxID=2776705 RepID=UPI001865FDBF|nr:MBG domain-containing protein [Luteolibacter marinus]
MKYKQHPAKCASLAKFAALTASCWALGNLQIRAEDSLADLLARPGTNLSDPDSRTGVVRSIQEITARRRDAARQRALGLGLPLRITRPNGVIEEITAFEGDTPLYFTTQNANAAISTGANLTRSTYAADGAGITIGIWDGGSARSTHQEFGGRVNVMDGAGSVDHATHVGGTLAAAGVISSAKGMAPAATLDSYDWNSDVAEMTSRAATGANQPGKLYLSNHSYSYISGWNYVNNGSRVWEWWGNGTTSAGSEQDFGRYNTYTRDQDALAYSAPYYLIFRSAGNERTDNPVAGEKVALSPGSPSTVNFDPALHPGGDGQYRGGYDCIGFEALAKNVITVGSASDAVTGGLRDPSKANVSSFSSWGPTDDGRIKPDVVANGEAVYSPVNANNSAYASYYGTSMATPNAAGSAALLIDLYGTLFPSQAMRASTLKGLLIHTADDRGIAGPDYSYGWGMVNAKAAADLISDHAGQPEKQRITEDSVSTSITTRTFPFVWDGTSPIRATLTWTDPAGTATSTSDLRSARLVNNLQLKLVEPGGAEHLPYVMPFVGNWSQGSMSSAAVTGINNTDNVEQVWLSAPSVAGTYQAVVSYSGSLTNGQQVFSLLLDGSAAVEPPPLPLAISSISPESAFAGPVTIDLTGDGFETDTAVKMSRTGQADVPATSVVLTGGKLRCQFDLSAAAPGTWDVVATNPDDETFTLADAFTLTGALWSESFDGTVSGWTSQASTGSNNWSLATNLSQSPATSYFAPAPSSKTTTALTSPVIPVPASASNLQLRFWHNYSLQSGQDGGKFELSVDGGGWFEVVSSGSGAVFASNGYNTSIRKGGGAPSSRSEFEDSPVWSGNSGGFVETIVNLTDTAKYAGKNLRLRWRLATNSSTASTGWYVDSIVLVGDADLTNSAPVVTTAPSTGSLETVTDPDLTIYEVIRDASADLTVAASDDGGEAALNYTWSVANGPGAAVFFTPNGHNAAKSCSAQFEATGDYELSVTIQDGPGLATSASVFVRVLETASDLQVSPATTTLAVGGTQTFSASQLDQFGQTMSTQPSSFTWEASGGGSIDSSGLFTATTAGGPFVVTATSGSFSNTASITVNPATATVSLGAVDQTYDQGNPREVTVTTIPAGLDCAVTYDGSPIPPVDAGTYAVEANIIDPNYQGSASGTLTVAKATATIGFSGLAATFDGTPKAVVASTTPGGLAVDLTYDGSPDAPLAIGTYQVSATIDDPNHSGTAAAELVISGQSYAQWQALEFTPAEILAGDADADADIDRDGLVNFAEHALGTDPHAFTPPPAFVLDPGFLTLTFTRPIGLADVDYHAESGTNPGPWSPVVLEVTGATATTETVRARVARSLAPDRQFLRLRFEQSGP